MEINQILFYALCGLGIVCIMAFVLIVITANASNINKDQERFTNER